jgi:peptide/nickel transport system substrate-binding protein
MDNCGLKESIRSVLLPLITAIFCLILMAVPVIADDPDKITGANDIEGEFSFNEVASSSGGGGGVTNLMIFPSIISASLESTFTVTVKAQCGTQPIDGIDVYLDFDPAYMAVRSATPGTSLSVVLVPPVYDNNTGTFGFSAGQLSSPFPSGTFTVVSITFQAKSITTSPTSINFHTAGSRTTTVDWKGDNIAGDLTGTAVQIIPGAVVDLSMVLQGGSRPDAGWIVPLKVKFFTPDDLTGTPVYTFNLITVKSGSRAIAQATGITPGTYDISVKSPHCLMNVERSVVVSSTSTDVDMGILLEGNTNDDDKINIQDFGLLVGTYGKSSGDTGYDARADLDRNDTINVNDFGLLSANYGKNAPIEGQSKSILKIITGGMMNIGCPWKGNAPPDLFYICPAVETLLRPDKDGNAVPWLATGWVIAPDYKSITFTLRKGVKFHDGTPFNAEALKFNFEKNAASPMPELKAITSVDVIDDYTAKVNLSKYEPHIFSFLATGRPGWIVSPTAARSMTDDEMMTHPVGTGPFKFQEYRRDVSVKFTKFENYWQEGKPYLDGIEYIITTDPVNAMMVFKKGDAQVHYNVSPKEGSDLQKEGYNVTGAKGSIYQLIPDSLNADSPWSKLEVRQAAQYAIDTVAMANTLGYGWADPYYNQVFPKGTPAYNPEIIGYPYDPAKAKALLAEAGYPNGFKTTMICSVPLIGDLETVVQSYLKQVGIDIELKPAPGAAYTQCNMQGWQNGLFRSQSPSSTGSDPGYQMMTYLGTPAKQWVSAARPQSVQDLLNAATFDLQERDTILKSLCKDIIDDHALIISTYGVYLLAAKQNEVKNDNIRTIWSMTWTPEEAWLNK